MEQNPELQIHLVLSDEQVDPVQGGFDLTLRIADLESSSLIARKIVPIERVICAWPDRVIIAGGAGGSLRARRYPRRGSRRS